MDGLLTSVIGAAPQLGGAGLLIAVLVILVRRESQTTERHGTELDRMARLHDAELAEKDEENDRLRTRVRDLEQRLNTALDERWMGTTGPAPRHRHPGQG